MTASFHHRMNLDKTYFTVLCDGEMHTYATRAEVEHHLTGTFGQPYSVVEWNAAENSAADVTLDFAPVEDEPSEDDDYPTDWRTRHTALMRRTGAFGR